MELEPGASEKEIRVAYAKMAKKTPPDTHPEAFTQLREAYETALEHVQAQGKAHTSKKQSLIPPPPDSTYSLEENNLSSQSAGKLSKLGTLSIAPTADKPKGRETRTGQIEAGADSQGISTSANTALTDTKTEGKPITTKPASSLKAGSGPDTPKTQATTSIPTTTQKQEPDQTPATPVGDISQNDSPVVDNSSASTAKIQAHLISIEALLSKSSTYDASIEKELLSITDDLDLQLDQLGLTEHDHTLQQLAGLILDKPSTPYGFMQRIATRLELDTVMPVSTPFWLLQLQRKNDDMQAVHKFEIRANGKDKFAKHFIHGGAKPFRFSGFPNNKDIKKYAATVEWLESVNPPRPDLIHPDSLEVAKRIGWLTEKTPRIPSSHKPSRPIDSVVVFGLLAFWLFFVPIRFFSTASPPSGRDLMRDISPEAQTRVDKIKQQRLEQEYPDFKNLVTLGSVTVRRLSTSVGEENFQQLDEDLANTELLEFAGTDTTAFKFWKKMLDANIDPYFRTDPKVLAQLVDWRAWQSSLSETPEGLQVIGSDGTHIELFEFK